MTKYYLLTCDAWDEKIVCGVYPTEFLAQQRLFSLSLRSDKPYSMAKITPFELSPMGVDLLEVI